MTTFASRDAPRTAVIVAHPGHELMIYHWIERRAPMFCCLTDGSGGSAASRVASTTRLLETVGATPGPVYGRYADKAIYGLLLDARVDVFVALAQELADALIAADVACVAGDAVEGFNPVHDVCRILIDAAVAIVRRRTGREILNYEFALDTSPAAAIAAAPPGTELLRLDEPALERKLAAAFAYPEMRGEVEAALARFGRGAFAIEVLQPACGRRKLAGFDETAPGYERSGHQRVTEGRYSAIIRFRDHIQPVLQAMDTAG